MTIRGALITKSADQTSVDLTGGAFPTFNSVVYDTQTIVGSNQFFTVPAGYNNAYGIVTLNMSFSSVTTPDGFQVWVAKNSGGSLFTGITWAGVPVISPRSNGNGQAANTAWLSLSTGPILLATGDRYEGMLQCLTDTSLTIEQESSLGLYVLDTYSWGHCVAKMAADQTAANYSTPAVIAWNGTDVLDTHGIHSPSSSNTKFIIPASLNGRYVVVGANVHATSVSNGQGASIAIRKGGSLTYSGMGGNSISTTDFGFHSFSCKTQAIQVSTGDEFEALLYCADTSIDISAARSNFWMRVIA